MSELTTDRIARMLEDAHAHSVIINGIKQTAVTTDALTMVLSELLRLRAERDAAVAEAVRVERERAAMVAQRAFGIVPGCREQIVAAIRRGE